MKTNEPRDDEILGRALARAIETIETDETPFDRSRIGMRPLRRGLPVWRFAIVTAVTMIAVAVAALVTEPPATDGPAAVQPTGTPAPTATPEATVGASPKPTPVPTAVDRQRIYYARDQLPPVGAHVDVLPGGTTDITTLPTAAERIGVRIAALINAGPAPTGAFNAMPPRSAVQGVTGVQIDRDLARVDLVVNAGNWQVSGAARTTAVLQQLVYTATEEPGIRRVLFTQNGFKPATIDQVVTDKPLAREDVFGYSFRSALGKDNGIEFGGDDSKPHVAGRLISTLVERDRVRLTFEGRGEGDQRTTLPSLEVHLQEGDETGRPSTRASGSKYSLIVGFQWNGGGSSGGAAGTTYFDQTPLRSITSNSTTSYNIALDDARPWRAYLLDPSRLVVEIGGDPRAVSDRIAVYGPRAGDTVSRDITVAGAARTFEANVVWRVRDRDQKVVATGHTTATIGTSPVWGTFETMITLPATVSGNVTLEVFESSPRDGSDQGLVSIPLTVR